MSKVYSKPKVKADQHKVPPEHLLQYLSANYGDDDDIVEEKEEDSSICGKECDGGCGGRSDSSSSLNDVLSSNEETHNNSIQTNDEEDDRRHFEFAGWSSSSGGGDDNEGSEGEALFVSDWLNSSQYVGCTSCSSKEEELMATPLSMNFMIPVCVAT